MTHSIMTDGLSKRSPAAPHAHPDKSQTGRQDMQHSILQYMPYKKIDLQLLEVKCGRRQD